MIPEEFIRAWKDSELREDGRLAGHPAGEIVLDHVGGNADGDTLTISTCVFNCTMDWICPIPTLECGPILE